MRILITGGAGFIGSHLLLHWAKTHPNDVLLNMDCLSYASDIRNLKDLEGRPNYQFEKVNLVDRPAVRRVLQSYKPEGIVHLAAESHVDNSIQDPQPFILSNIVGTFNLLEEARQLWQSFPSSQKPRFHHVSTDEVYGALGDTGVFTEDSQYAPNSPYSASKASSDHIVRAYHKTYGLNAVISNCSNNFGPHQHSEKLIPNTIRKALAHLPIPVYGAGQNTRDWLYVGDHCSAIDLIFHEGKPGRNYNVGSENEWKNIDLVRAICDLLNEMVGKGPDGDYKRLIQFVSDRPGHDMRYAIDPKRITGELGWRPRRDFMSDLKTTISWYLERS